MHEKVKANSRVRDVTKILKKLCDSVGNTLERWFVIIIIIIIILKHNYFETQKNAGTIGVGTRPSRLLRVGYPISLP